MAKKGLIAIGPEGDFFDNEVHLLCDANVSPVHLGHLRLRTETAEWRLWPNSI